MGSGYKEKITGFRNMAFPNVKLFQNFDFVNSHEALNFIYFVMYQSALNFFLFF